jgi:hypothetical protein
MINIIKTGNSQPYQFADHYLNTLDNYQKNIKAVLIFF